MIIAKRNLPNAAYNCAMRRVVNRNAFVELRIRGIQKRHLLDQPGPCITAEQRVAPRKSFFDTKLPGVINTRSVVSSRADVCEFRKRPQQLLALDRVRIQSCARRQAVKRIRYVSSEKIDRRWITNAAGRKQFRGYCVQSVIVNAQIITAAANVGRLNQP